MSRATPAAEAARPYKQARCSQDTVDALVNALTELHAIDERKLSASERRTYRIGHCTIQERVERNRALLARSEKGTP